MRPLVWILPLIAGCVLSVEERKTFPDDIHTIVLDVSKGDVSIEGARGDVTLEVDFGGIGSGDVGHGVSDGVLTVDYDCGGPELCGGELTLTAPPGTDLDLELGAGDLVVTGMRGDVIAVLGAGSIAIDEHGGGTVIADTAAGEIGARFDRRPAGVELSVATGEVFLEVPAGAYALDLDGTSVTVDGVDEDPDSDVLLKATAAAGAVEVVGI